MAKIKTISEIIEDVSPYYKEKGGPEAAHTIVYDSSSETLEPVYFFILDLLNDFGLKPEKIIDNFSSSPGSGHFGELGQRATVMQQQAAQNLERVNAVLRSVLNIIYDLKEFRIRLQSYNDLKSKDKEKREAALLSLKQIWMDKVDMAKGQSSIKAMALGQAGFQTLIDAFLVAQNEKDADKLDLNDRVRRIVKSRIAEFNIWLKRSEEELRKRYELEKHYLRSQVNSLKLYSRWAKPYLRAAMQLEAKSSGMEREAALVKTFNTIILEMTLLGKTKLNVKSSAIEGNLPEEFSKESFLRTLKRNYYSCVIVEFRFRGIPQRIMQRGDYVFGGRAEVTFMAYALNDDELKKLNEEVEKSDIGDVLQLIEGTTTESLDQIQEEINFFLEEKSDEEKSKKSKDESNPFLALIGYYDRTDKNTGKKKKAEGKEKRKELVPDNWIEKNHLRRVAGENAKNLAFDIFDIYKKAHGMASFT